MHPRSTSVAGLVALAFSLPAAQAQTASPAEPSASAPQTTLPAVKVRATAETPTGPVSGYRARRAATATKTDTALSETPQSVTVVTRDQIVDQGATNLQDALNYAAGVRSDAYGLDSRTDSVRVRGVYPDEYLDGLRKAFNYYTSNARTDPFTLERIEVLRGPSAMLYGQGSTGGVVNLVSKRPQAAASGEIGVQFGSFDRKQLQADFTGPLTDDGQWVYRVVGVVRKSDTQVDHVRDDRALLAPSLTWRPSAATSLTLQALVQKDRTGSTSQFFPWSGVLLPNPNGPLPTHRFTGEPGWDRYDTDRRSVGWLLEHRLNDAWTVRQNTRYSLNDVDYRSHYGDSFASSEEFGDPTDASERLLGRYADASDTRFRLFSTDQHVEGKLNLGGLEHTVLAGLDTARSSTTGKGGTLYPAYYGGALGVLPSIDAYAPVYGNLIEPPMVDRPRTGIRHAGLYLQDQVKWGAWTGVLGLRHDRATSTTAGGPSSSTQATSKRLGALYQTPWGFTPYVSYSESFTPIAGINGQEFKPLRGEQWEVGVKVEPVGADFIFNASLYDLKEKNQLKQPSPNVYLQLDKTSGHGLEVEFKGKLSSATELIAHYNNITVDSQIEATSKHQAAAWISHRFSLGTVGGLRAGGGLRWFSAFKDGPAPETPSVALLDLMASWEMAKWRVALNVNNATDKTYVSTCGARGDCWFGSRRNVVATVSYLY